MEFKREILKVGGIPPIVLPNSTLDGTGFYVSYNNCDHYIYGSDTTALVYGQMETFYILDGDHRKQYIKLVPLGWDACFQYFLENIENANKYSDKPMSCIKTRETYKDTSISDIMDYLNLLNQLIKNDGKCNSIADR